MVYFAQLLIIPALLLFGILICAIITGAVIIAAVAMLGAKSKEEELKLEERAEEPNFPESPRT